MPRRPDASHGLIGSARKPAGHINRPNLHSRETKESFETAAPIAGRECAEQIPR
jgi:hypothetical protein